MIYFRSDQILITLYQSQNHPVWQEMTLASSTTVYHTETLSWNILRNSQRDLSTQNTEIIAHSVATHSVAIKKQWKSSFNGVATSFLRPWPFWAHRNLFWLPRCWLQHQLFLSIQRAGWPRIFRSPSWTALRTSHSRLVLAPEGSAREKAVCRSFSSTPNGSLLRPTPWCAVW